MLFDSYRCVGDELSRFDDRVDYIFCVVWHDCEGVASFVFEARAFEVKF